MEVEVRVLETDFFPEEYPLIEKLREMGRFVYFLRDWDMGSGYNIEKYCVTVNRIGHMITDTDLSPYMHDNYWIGIDEIPALGIKFIEDQTLRIIE